MALVSGRPISFQMDLYTPLYVPRPTVVPELFASLRPVTYNGDLWRNIGITLPKPEGALHHNRESSQRQVIQVDCWDRSRDGTRRGPGPGPKDGPGSGGVSTMATATKLGDFFQYAIDKPVTLPRQKSALLPIVNKDVEGSAGLHLQRDAPRPSSRCWASSSRTPAACT